MDNKALKTGEFITVPAWNVTGCVLDVQCATLGSDDAITVTLQEHPDQDPKDARKYRLEPDQYTLDN